MTEHAASANDEFPEPRGDGAVEVVGTAHVSEHSVEEVEERIESSRPDIVAVELDEGRYRQMQGEAPDDLDAGTCCGATPSSSSWPTGCCRTSRRD